jgi:hypothetical protein
LVNPSEIAGLAAYPAVLCLFQEHIDMQFADVRVWMRFPMNPEFQEGFNLATASRLMEMVSGLSVILYEDPDPKVRPATEPKDRGARFQHLLAECWPHDPATDPPKDIVAQILYYFTRNSLTHALGLRQPGEPQILIVKAPLTPAQIERLEREPSLPEFVPGRPLQVMGLNAYRIEVRGLYWATYRLVENLIATPSHVRAAEQAIAKGTWIP